MSYGQLQEKKERRLEHGVGPMEFKMTITHWGRNVSRQVDLWVWSVREKPRLETKIGEPSFLLLCLSMPCCLDQLRTLIPSDGSVLLYLPLWGGGHGELGRRKYRAAQSLWPSSCWIPSTWSTPQPSQVPCRKPWAPADSQGSWHHSSLWSVHLTVTIPFLTQIILCLLLSFSKLNKYTIGDTYTAVKTSEKQEHD